MLPRSSAGSPLGQPKPSPWRGLWVLPLSAALLVGGIFLIRNVRQGANRPLVGYQADPAVLEREYHRFYGRLMRDPEPEQLFQQANSKVRQRDYAAAARLLESASRSAAVPVIYNNLGVLFASLRDRQRTAEAFGEALARDTDYRPARDNIDRLRGFVSDLAEPVSREAEPNDSLANANLFELNVEVQAEIAAGTKDADCFRFVSPPAPRDVLKIEIAPSDPRLEIGFRLYGGDMGITDLVQNFGIPGERVARYFTPPANTEWYLEIWGAHESTGAYSVRVHPLRAFDAYEPNDDIFSATKIEVGRTVEANILDADDTDFYAFESPRSGQVAIEIENRSSGLIPALTTFSSDKRTTGFGPDLTTPGASLHHTLSVEAHQTYYLQVWSQGGSSGQYALTVK